MLWLRNSRQQINISPNDFVGRLYQHKIQKRGNMADPKQLILQYRQQVMSNNQIVQQLEQQGFKSHIIFDAMNKVDMVGAGPLPMSSLEMPQQPMQPPQRPVSFQLPQSQSLPPMDSNNMPGGIPPMPPMSSPQMSDESVDDA